MSRHAVEEALLVVAGTYHLPQRRGSNFPRAALRSSAPNFCIQICREVGSAGRDRVRPRAARRVRAPERAATSARSARYRPDRLPPSSARPRRSPYRASASAGIRSVARNVSAITHCSCSSIWYISIQPPTRSSSARRRPRQPVLRQHISPICSAMVDSDVCRANASGERKISLIFRRPCGPVFGPRWSPPDSETGPHLARAISTRARAAALRSTMACASMRGERWFCHELAIGHHRPVRPRRVPIDGAGMLEAPVDRNPPRPPRLESQLFGARGVPAHVEQIEILPRENVPVAVPETPAASAAAARSASSDTRRRPGRSGYRQASRE